jgi:lipopolysaccharide export LptBFGC system permease protein LptF
MRELGSRELILLIDHAGYGQRPADQFRTWLYAPIGSAFAPGLLMFLVISLAQRFRRTGSFTPLMLFSIGIGFAYFVFDGICLTMGETGFLPPGSPAGDRKSPSPRSSHPSSRTAKARIGERAIRE